VIVVNIQEYFPRYLELHGCVILPETVTDFETDPTFLLPKYLKTVDRETEF